MISIRVPATTANIGPGYDVLGAALTLYASFEAELSEKLEISGCPEEFQNEDNLVIRSYKKTLSDCGKDYVPIRLAIDTNVPIARGLGSSSTCIAAGVLAADSLHGLGLSRDRIVSICTEIEGHPDNVAPAVYGGVVAGFSDGKDIHTIRYTPDEVWRFVTVIPDYEVHTEEARRVVKKEIELSDGIYSTGHVLGLIRALETGDEELLSAACRDILHEPYRKGLIKDYEKARKLALENGAATFFISGSGSTLMAAVKAGEREEAVLAAFREAFSSYEVMTLRICHEGAIVKDI